MSTIDANDDGHGWSAIDNVYCRRAKHYARLRRVDASRLFDAMTQADGSDERMRCDGFLDRLCLLATATMRVAMDNMMDQRFWSVIGFNASVVLNGLFSTLRRRLLWDVARRIDARWLAIATHSMRDRLQRSEYFMVMTFNFACTGAENCMFIGNYYYW
jgi:hypothetical protein